ncbi:MAG: hypothetical protein AAGG48_23860 [Planctomycetota bacterium]
MSRIASSFMVAFCVGFLSLAAVGCGGDGENTVNEDTRTTAEIEQEEEDYEQQMEDSAGDDVTE